MSSIREQSTPKEALDVEIRVLGAGVTVSNSNGSNLTFVPTEAQFSYAGASYQRIFYGTNNDVDPNEVVYSGKVKSGKSLRFGGRYYYNRSWSYFYHSQQRHEQRADSGQWPDSADRLSAAHRSQLWKVSSNPILMHPARWRSARWM